MIYTANITTVKDTPATSLKRTVLPVTKGLVYRVEFHFPPGPAGLVGLAVFDGLYQVWPSSLGVFFISDGETIAFDDMYLKESEPYQFDIMTYNTDDTYDHTVSVRIGLVLKDIFLARFLPTKGFDYLMDLTRQLEAEKAAAALLQQKQREETPYEWLISQLEELK